MALKAKSLARASTLVSHAWAPQAVVPLHSRLPTQHASYGDQRRSPAAPELLPSLPRAGLLASPAIYSPSQRRGQTMRTRAFSTIASLADGALAAAPVVLSFTPQAAVAGGLVLGTATVAKLLLTGRILGISGAFKGIIHGDSGMWRAMFLAGLASASFVLHAYMPSALETLPATLPVWQAALSGLLVGFGAAMGNGCTSGHGICGNARLSPRSMVYTATFMATGMATATLMHSADALSVAPVAAAFHAMSGAEAQVAGAIMAASVALLGASTLAARNASAAAKPTIEKIAEAVIGLTFGLGLGLSGMTHASKVVGFLSPLSPAWDLSLMFVMGGALAVALVGFQGVVARKVMTKPVLLESFCLPSNTTIDGKLLAGGMMFGAGWGLSGMCPGPALVNLAVMTPQLAAYLGSMGAGMALERAWAQRAVATIPKQQPAASAAPAVPPPASVYVLESQAAQTAAASVTQQLEEVEVVTTTATIRK